MYNRTNITDIPWVIVKPLIPSASPLSGNFDVAPFSAQQNIITCMYYCLETLSRCLKLQILQFKLNNRIKWNKTETSKIKNMAFILQEDSIF